MAEYDGPLTPEEVHERSMYALRLAISMLAKYPSSPAAVDLYLKTSSRVPAGKEPIMERAGAYIEPTLRAS